MHPSFTLGIAERFGSSAKHAPPAVDVPRGHLYNPPPLDCESLPGAARGKHKRGRR